MSHSPPDTHDEIARALALAATLVVLGVVLTVFYDLVATYGGLPWLVVYVALAFAGATAAARRAPTRTGVLAAVGLFAVGLLGYVVLLPSQYYGLFTVEAFADDISGWLTGRSVALMLHADLWAVSVAPAPVFLVWYLAVRGRYDATTLAGAGTLAFFVLTGDLGEVATLFGVSALLALVGFGAVATTDANWRQVQEVGLVVGLVLLLTRLVQVVPASSVDALSGGGEGSQSLEQTLLSNRDKMEVGGSPSLSAAPRFTVRSEEKAYWHTRSFDHYGGQAWSRTERAMGVERPLDPPASTGTTLKQSVTVESSTGAMPAAWKPVLLDTGTRELATVGATGNLEPAEPLTPGTTYEVISEVPYWTEEKLTGADDDYGGRMLERYTQLPSDLPDRLVEKTDDIVADADGVYETAVTIQTWLTENKRYSLGVERRDWDIADAFVFALDSGYCVYFATAMAVMLRTQGIPSRFTVGYAPGERVDDGEWLVRGYHSHAWVEVYFPDIGWVTFDPTPAGPRQRAQQRERERAATETESVGDTPVTATPTPTPTPTPTATAGTNNSTETPAGTSTVDGVPLPGEGAGNATFTPTPTEEQGLPGAVRAGGNATTAPPTSGRRGTPGGRLWMLGALATLAFGSIRLGYAQSAFRSVWVRYQRRTGDPDRDVERAVERMEYHLGSKFRPREDGETRQDYLADLEEHGIGRLDDRAWRVLDIHQRSRYGDGADDVMADEAVRLVDEMVR